jgi:hypothetical protein
MISAATKLEKGRQALTEANKEYGRLQSQIQLAAEHASSYKGELCEARQNLKHVCEKYRCKASDGNALFNSISNEKRRGVPGKGRLQTAHVRYDTPLTRDFFVQLEEVSYKH